MRTGMMRIILLLIAASCLFGQSAASTIPQFTREGIIPLCPPQGSCRTLGSQTSDYLTTPTGIFRVGGKSPPMVLYKVDPEYSDEARKAKYQGTVLLAVQIDPDGNVTSIRVVHALGLGLDLKALEAVRKWKFRPYAPGGMPMALEFQVEVNFRL
jgi:TonB family protein